MPPEVYQNYQPFPDGIPDDLAHAKENAVKVEKIEIGNGINVYLEGHPYPVKGYPSSEAVFAINAYKRLLKHFPFLVLFPKKLDNLSAIMLGRFFIKEQYQTPFTQEFTKILIHFFPTNTAQAIAHIFEYDNSYRFRLQDLFSETTKELFSTHPYNEIIRLSAINRERDQKDVAKKIQPIFRLFAFILRFPPLHGKFQRTIKSTDFLKLQFDESDIYWTNLRTDYAFRGRNNRV